jgi:hypothetical protein
VTGAHARGRNTTRAGVNIAAMSAVIEISDTEWALVEDRRLSRCYE